MDNDIILLFVTYYAITVVSIILILNLIQYLTKKNLKNEVKLFDIKKNEIIDGDILSELSKVETLSKTETIKEKYEIWKSEIDKIKEDLDSFVNDMIIDADFLVERKDYKEYIEKEKKIE